MIKEELEFCRERVNHYIEVRKGTAAVFKECDKFIRSNVEELSLKYFIEDNANLARSNFNYNYNKDLSTSFKVFHDYFTGNASIDVVGDRYSMSQADAMRAIIYMTDLYIHCLESTVSINNIVFRIMLGKLYIFNDVGLYVKYKLGNITQNQFHFFWNTLVPLIESKVYDFSLDDDDDILPYLGLSTAYYNALKRWNIRTVADFRLRSNNDFKNLRGMGNGGRLELISKFNKLFESNQQSNLVREALIDMGFNFQSLTEFSNSKISGIYDELADTKKIKLYNKNIGRDITVTLKFSSVSLSNDDIEHIKTTVEYLLSL